MTFKYFGRTNKPKDPRRLIIQQKGYGPNWPAARKAVLERDNYTCQYCQRKGQKRNGRWDVHVHHKRKIAYFADTLTGEVDYEAANHPDNLIVACQYGCHKHYDGHQNNSGFAQLR